MISFESVLLPDARFVEEGVITMLTRLALIVLADSFTRGRRRAGARVDAREQRGDLIVNVTEEAVINMCFGAYKVQAGANDPR